MLLERLPVPHVLAAHETVQELLRDAVVLPVQIPRFLLLVVFAIVLPVIVLLLVALLLLFPPSLRLLPVVVSDVLRRQVDGVYLVVFSFFVFFLDFALVIFDVFDELGFDWRAFAVIALLEIGARAIRAEVFIRVQLPPATIAVLVI